MGDAFVTPKKNSDNTRYNDKRNPRNQDVSVKAHANVGRKTNRGEKQKHINNPENLIIPDFLTHGNTKQK